MLGAIAEISIYGKVWPLHKEGFKQWFLVHYNQKSIAYNLPITQMKHWNSNTHLDESFEALH